MGGYSSGPGSHAHGHPTMICLTKSIPIRGALARFLPMRPPKHGGVHRWDNEFVFLDAQGPV